MYEGIIIKYRNQLPVFINSAIECGKSYYIRRVKLPNLSVGKVYTDLLKRKVAIISKNDEQLCFRGMILGSGEWTWYSPNGKDLNNGEYPADLIEEVE